MNRVLLTGSTGFTGRYLRSELSRHGWEVWGIGSQPIGGEKHYIQADLTDVAALTHACLSVQPKAVIHLAAVSFVAHRDIEQMYRVNLMGTRNLLAALAQCKVPECVILASSGNVYGAKQEGCLNESTVAIPGNDYAVTKLAMEYMAGLWREKLPLVITRPFNYTGIGQSLSFVVPKIVDHFQRKAEAIQLGNVDVSRDFSDVRQVASIYRRLLENPPVGETVNICSGKAISLRNVLSWAKKMTGHSLQVIVNPDLVRECEIEYLCGDKSKLERLIGTLPEQPFEETLHWMLHGEMG